MVKIKSGRLSIVNLFISVRLEEAARHPGFKDTNADTLLDVLLLLLLIAKEGWSVGLNLIRCVSLAKC